MSFAFIFPGQGSQAVGMGKELADAFPAAKAVFDEVDAALGEKLSDLIWGGSIETLTLTANAQPALMAVSLAASRALEAGFGVKISQAVSVTPMVCSYCADRERSRVTAVQPSDKTFTWARPRLIIGSTVKIIPARISTPSLELP